MIHHKIASYLKKNESTKFLWAAAATQMLHSEKYQISLQTVDEKKYKVVKKKNDNNEVKYNYV